MRGYSQVTIGKDLSKLIKKVVNKNNISKLAEELKEDIVKRTRLGSGVKGNGESKQKLAPTAESTKKSKRRRRGELSSLTSPTKSNLTDTGQMLDSVAVTQVDNNSFTIGFDNTEAQEKAEFAHEGSNNRPKREFMFVSKREFQRHLRRVKDILDTEIKRL